MLPFLPQTMHLWETTCDSLVFVQPTPNILPSHRICRLPPLCRLHSLPVVLLAENRDQGLATSLDPQHPVDGTSDFSGLWPRDKNRHPVVDVQGTSARESENQTALLQLWDVDTKQMVQTMQGPIPLHAILKGCNLTCDLPSGLCATTGTNELLITFTRFCWPMSSWQPPRKKGALWAC